MDNRLIEYSVSKLHTWKLKYFWNINFKVFRELSKFKPTLNWSLNKPFKILHVIQDTQHVTCETWHVTHEMCHVWLLLSNNAVRRIAPASTGLSITSHAKHCALEKVSTHISQYHTFWGDNWVWYQGGSSKHSCENLKWGKLVFLNFNFHLI